MPNTAPHSFHIPVMGLAYTIDSPIKVARFGIASVISIVEDRLIEMMRSYYYKKTNLTYFPISANEEDYRAKRITDYLNLVNHIVKKQVNRLKQETFEKGSEILKYFEMLPEAAPLKKIYRQFVHTKDETEKRRLEVILRSNIKAGSIDVNIMTKTDRDKYSKDGKLVEDGSDAVAALRGYANSDLTDSAVVFSAGMNPRLYNYLEKCSQFRANEAGEFGKKVIIKVSDYRSALIQGKYLAKKGIWVSEFRVESGLNCGGHAFATDGFLLGPILEEFKLKKQELMQYMFELYKNSTHMRNRSVSAKMPDLSISVQGGIGTCHEDNFLRDHYTLQSTGWGSPFLLVPEATTVDKATVELLGKARQNDVVLSHNSPLGVRFHYLKGTTSHQEKLARIEKGKPGSPCIEKHLALNTEFTNEPICTASRKYQKLKAAQLQTLNLPAAQLRKELDKVYEKECLCVGLSNAAAAEYNIPFIKNLQAVSICPGPNIAYFSNEVSLQTMVDHIYGRTNIISDAERPHMFVAELKLYVTYLQEQLSEFTKENSAQKKRSYFLAFLDNLSKGIVYYKNLPVSLIENPTAFHEGLENASRSLCDLATELNSIES